MNKALYIFNPWHDLALANSDPNFNPPLSAQKFELDCSMLPVWFGEPKSVVFCNKDLVQWMSEIQINFEQLARVEISNVLDKMAVSDIRPWGWDEVVRTKLLNAGFDCKLMPDINSLKKIRELSSRHITTKVLNIFNENDVLRLLIPESASIITELSEVFKFEQVYGNVVFKAPWSGSGKGLRWVRAGMTDSHSGWCKNVLSKQGSIIAERVYDKIQDFAMEFFCKNGQTDFAGYSLFNTENGIYRSNELISDIKIVDALTQQGIESKTLQAVRSILVKFIDEQIAPYYSGPLGVDMLVYKEDSIIKIHPCVEINLRYTMGYVARIFYDRFVQPGVEGKFFVDHIPKFGEILQDHLWRKVEFPLIIDKGKIVKGYLALNYIDEDTCYRVRVEVR